MVSQGQGMRPFVLLSPLQTARMLSKSGYLSLAGLTHPGSVLPAWLQSTLQTVVGTSGNSCSRQLSTSAVPSTLQDHLIISLEAEEGC